MIRRFSFVDLDEILDIERQAFPKSPYDRATFANLQWLYPETFFVYVNRSSQQGEGQIVGYRGPSSMEKEGDWQTTSRNGPPGPRSQKDLGRSAGEQSESSGILFQSGIPSDRSGARLLWE
jgi:ribosomal protein S18 acetylase RimI-like enzyme